MIFKRREKVSYFVQFKESFLPRTGWKRAIEYFAIRIKRLPDSPHKIALGLTCGIFACFLPIFGFHFLIAAILAYLVNGNIVAAIFGTFFGNPVTFPLIASFSINLGQRLLGQELIDVESLLEKCVKFFDALWRGFKAIFGYGKSDWKLVFDFASEIFFPYLVGGFLLGFVTALTSYVVLRPMILAYQLRRRNRKLRKLKMKRKVFQGGKDG